MCSSWEHTLLEIQMHSFTFWVYNTSGVYMLYPKAYFLSSIFAVSCCLRRFLMPSFKHIKLFISLKHRLSENHRRGVRKAQSPLLLLEPCCQPFPVPTAEELIPKGNFISMCNRAYLQFILLMFLLTPKKSSEWIFGGRRTLEANKGWGLRF